MVCCYCIYSLIRKAGSLIVYLNVIIIIIITTSDYSVAMAFNECDDSRLSFFLLKHKKM